MQFDLIVSLVGLLTSISSIAIAFLAFRRNEKLDVKKEGKNEAIIISEIGYIKACIDRVEKRMSLVDERYHDLLERLTKVEAVIATTKSINK